MLIKYGPMQLQDGKKLQFFFFNGLSKILFFSKSGDPIVSPTTQNINFSILRASYRTMVSLGYG